MPFDSFVDTLETLAASGDQNELDVLWGLLIAGNQVPYVEGEKVAFLYRGEASSVGWVGDFSYWERGQPLVGSQVGQSDIWVAYATFPTNARLDYLIVVDGQKWELDPANPVQQWGGYGPRSVLAMPDYRSPSETVERPAFSQVT